MTAAAQARNPATVIEAQNCAMAQSHLSDSGVGHRLGFDAYEQPIRRAHDAADKHADLYATTGCLAALGRWHRAELLLSQLKEARHAACH